MPELFHVDGVAKVRVFGREATLDGLRAPSGTLVGRIAPQSEADLDWIAAQAARATAAVRDGVLSTQASV